MKLKDAIFGWNSPNRCSPKPGEVPGAVGAWHFRDGLKARDHGKEVPWKSYASAVGACDFERAKAKPTERLLFMFLDFHTMVVRDGIDPLKAHEAFLKVDEYRVRISPDIKGAE